MYKKIIIFLLLSNLLVAQSDVAILDNIKWGMTKSELSKFYSLTKCKNSDEPTCSLSLSIKKDNFSYNAGFTFDKEGTNAKLIKLFLLPADEVPRDKIIEKYAKKIKEKIIERYGSEYIKSSDKLIWKSSAGTVEYTYVNKKINHEIIRLLYTIFTPNLDPLGFRNIKWKNNLKKIKKTEKKKALLYKDNIIIFDDTILNLKAYVSYKLYKDKLVKGYYDFMEKHTNKNDYLTDYFLIEHYLIEKYGKPDEDNIVWKNDLYRNEKSQFGFAVSLGHLNIKKIWNFNSTIITLSIGGDNYEIYTRLSYDEKSNKDLIKKDIKNLDKL